MAEYVNHEFNVRFPHKDPPDGSVNSLGKLRELIQNENHPDGNQVKLFGGKHSFNHLLKTDGYVIDSRKIPQMLGITNVVKTPGNESADIGAAMTLGEAIHELNKIGLHFPIMGGWYSQTIAGLISTSTHGSSMKHYSLSDYVKAVEVVTAEGGEPEWISGNSDLMKAWRCNLGQLGVVTRVRFKLRKTFWLQTHFEELDDDDAFDKIQRMLNGSVPVSRPYVNMLWLPYHGKRSLFGPSNFGRCWIRTLSEKRGSKAKRSRKARKNEDEALERKKKGLFEMWQRAVQTYDVGLRWLKRDVKTPFDIGPFSLDQFYQLALIRRFEKDRGVIDRSFRVFLYGQYREPRACQRLRMVNNVEYAIDGRQFKTVMQRLKTRLMDRFNDGKKDGQVFNYPRVHIRFTNASDNTLIGLNQGRQTVYVGTYFSHAIDHEGINVKIAKELGGVLSGAGGRPHWGKYRYFEDDEYLDTYPHWEKFQNLRDELDPNNVFSDGGANMFDSLAPKVIKSEVEKILKVKKMRDIDPDWFPVPLYLLGEKGDRYGPHRTQTVQDAVKEAGSIAIKRQENKIEAKEDRKREKEEREARKAKRKAARAKKKAARKKKRAAKKKK